MFRTSASGYSASLCAKGGNSTCFVFLPDLGNVNSNRPSELGSISISLLFTFGSPGTKLNDVDIGKLILRTDYLWQK